MTKNCTDCGATIKHNNYSDMVVETLQCVCEIPKSCTVCGDTVPFKVLSSEGSCPQCNG